MTSEAKIPAIVLENKKDILYSAQDMLNMLEFLAQSKKFEKPYYDTLEIEQLFIDFLKTN